MNLKPTDVSLSIKNFNREICGYCFGCGCHCGFIAYMKDEEIADLYGHPYDKNSVGSLCNKGIALIAETDKLPYRIKDIMIKREKEFIKSDIEEVKALLSKRSIKKPVVIMGKFSTVEDYKVLRKLTKDIYTTGVFLPFRPSSVPPYEWSNMKLIIALETDPVNSEVMATRWIMDAVEKGAYLVNISSRYNTLSAKANMNLLMNPYQLKNVLENILEGKDEPWNRLKAYLETTKESLIIVSETLLKSPLRYFVISFIKHLRTSYGTEYAFIGNITNVEIKELKDINLESNDLIISVDNTLYEFDSLPENQERISFSLFPDFTAMNSNVIIPLPLFKEREATPIFNPFAYENKSTKFQNFPYTVEDTISYIFDISGQEEPTIYKNDIRDSEINIWEENDVRGGDIYVIVGDSPVEIWGHWYPWLHGLEREQKMYINKKTAEKLGIKEDSLFKGVRVEITNTVSDNTIFVSEGFEESQPFKRGVRKGRILNKPGFRIWRLME